MLTADYHLSPGSPAIDTGTATGAPSVDIDNEVRFMGFGFDMGADEFMVIADTTPNAFTFTDQTGAALNTTITSNSITVSGITTFAPISITGGQYSINGGAYTSSNGTVALGDTVILQVTSSSSYSTPTNATLTISGVSDIFTVTTIAEYTLGVTTSGAGKVLGSTGAINCGSTCSATLPEGTNLTLMASPAPGASFSSWTGCDITTGSICLVTISTNKNVIAAFTNAVQTISSLATMPIATTTGSEAAFNASFDGINYLVGIGGDINAPYNETAQRVDQTGAPVGSVVSLGGTGGTPLMAFDGARHLAVWQDDAISSDDHIHGQFVNPDGSPWNGTVEISTGPVSELGGIAFGNGSYLAAYSKTSDNTLYGNIVSAATGTAGTEFTISTGTAKDFFRNAAFDGTNFFAIWGDMLSGTDIRGRLIAPDGTLLYNELLIKSGGNQVDYWTTVGYFNGAYLVVWSEKTGMGNADYDLVGQLITPAGALQGSAFVISNAPGIQFFPGVTNDGSNFLVTWTDLRSDADGDMVCDPNEGSCMDIYGRYFNTSGAPVGAEFAVSTDPGDQFGSFSEPPANGKLFTPVNSNVNLSLGNPWDNVFGVFITIPADTTPEAFTFTDQTGVALNTTITSNAVTVSGINTASAVSITGGEYSINGKAYTSTAGTVNNGDTVTVQLTSSSSYLTTVNSILTIDGVSDTFSVTTAAPVVYTVTATAGAGGTISPASALVSYGSTTAFTVTPNAGYTATVGGTCGGTLVSNTYTTGLITAPCTVIASFTASDTTPPAFSSTAPASDSIVNTTTVG